MTSGAAHDHDAADFVDAARHLGDILFGGGDFGSRLERGDARNLAVRLGADEVLRQRQMRDAAAGIGGGDSLMDDARCLRRQGNGVGIERDVTEEQVRIRRLEILGALHLARHVPGDRKNRRVFAACFVEAGDEMSAAGPGTPATDSEPAGELRLARGCKRSPFFMADTDPFDLAVTDSVGECIERVGDQPKYLPDANLFERVDQYVRDRLSHAFLLVYAVKYRPSYRQA
jgi:hypothetical protein